MEMMLKKKFFVTLGKGQFKVKVKIENKNIYIIQAKHSCHYLSSIVIVLWDIIYAEYEVIPVNGIMLKKVLSQISSVVM